MMKKIFLMIAAITLIAISFPMRSFAAGGIYPSGKTSETAGSTFSVTIVASGVEFDSFQGVISVSGSLSVVSVSAGSATWLPGKSPAIGSQFVGMSSPTSSLALATLKLKAGSSGSGSVSVSGAELARNGAFVSSSGGTLNITIAKAPNLATVVVTSSTHPDQNSAYDATTIQLSWNKASGVTGFSYVLDDNPSTVPSEKVTSSDISISYDNQAIGTHYFHIRAETSDGWGNTTTFKFTIKAPEAKLDNSLKAPSGITIKKDQSFKNDIQNGNVSGILISGLTGANYKANLILSPALTLPDGKVLIATADKNGNFSYLIDFPIHAETYKLTIQGQDNLSLTPISDPVYFEISQKNGGQINILTSADENYRSTIQKIKDFYQNHKILVFVFFGLIILLITLLFLRRKIKSDKKFAILKNNHKEKEKNEE